MRECVCACMRECVSILLDNTYIQCTCIYCLYRHIHNVYTNNFMKCKTIPKQNIQLHIHVHVVLI